MILEASWDNLWVFETFLLFKADLVSSLVECTWTLTKKIGLNKTCVSGKSCPQIPIHTDLPYIWEIDIYDIFTLHVTFTTTMSILKWKERLQSHFKPFKVMHEGKSNQFCWCQLHVISSHNCDCNFPFCRCKPNTNCVVYSQNLPGGSHLGWRIMYRWSFLCTWHYLDP